MTSQLIALGVLALSFFIATVRSVHMGALTLAAALAVGLAAGQSVEDILGGFPVSVVLLLLGVTYLFGIARSNGTLEWIVECVVRRVGDRPALLPWVFFAVSAGMASLGSPLAAIILGPVALSFMDRTRRDPVPMGIALVTGGSAGGFAPTSLFGIITVGVAERGGVDLSPALLFGFVLAVNLVLLAAAMLIFRAHKGAPQGPDSPAETENSAASGSAASGSATLGPAETGSSGTDRAETPGRTGAGVATLTAPTVTAVDSAAFPGARPRRFQIATVLALAALVLAVIGLSVAGIDANVGALALGIGVVLSLLFPAETASAAKDIDWSTILLIVGVITYVGVLEHMGAVSLLGDYAKSLHTPLIAALAICLMGALVSAFASTTGILGILVPLALPLIAAGSLPATGLIIAVAVSSSLVDSTPFSTAGAAVVASTREADKPRMSRCLTRWGLSMIVIGPVLTCGVLIVPSLI